MESLINQRTIKTGLQGPTLQAAPGRGFLASPLDYGGAPQINSRGFVANAGAMSDIGRGLQVAGGHLDQIQERVTRAINERRLAEAEMTMREADNEVASEIAKHPNNPEKWESIANEATTRISQMLSSKDDAPDVRDAIGIRSRKWQIDSVGSAKVSGIHRQFQLTADTFNAEYMMAANDGRWDDAEAAIQKLDAGGYIAKDRAASMMIGLQNSIKSKAMDGEDMKVGALLTQGRIDEALSIYQQSSLRDTDEKRILIDKTRKTFEHNELVDSNKKSAEFYAEKNLAIANGSSFTPDEVNSWVKSGQVRPEHAVDMIENFKRREAGKPAPADKFQSFITDRVLSYDPTKDLDGAQYEQIQRDAFAMGADQLQMQRLHANISGVMDRSKTSKGRTETAQKQWMSSQVKKLMESGALGRFKSDSDSGLVNGMLQLTDKMVAYGLTEKQAEQVRSVTGPERLAMFQEFSKARYKTENGVRTPVFDSAEYEKLSDREKQLFASAESGKIDGVIVDEAKEREASLKAAMIEDQIEGFYQEFQQKSGRLPSQKEASSKLLELTSPYSATAIFDAGIFPQYKAPQASNSPSIRGFTDAPELANALPDGLAPYASDFLEAAQKYNLDPYALAAIAAHETGNGTSKALRNKNNAMGVSNSSGPRSFENVRDSIFAQAKTLSGPIYKGADTFDAVGRIYAPVGAENDPTSLNGYWPGGVSSHYAKLKQNASR